MTGSAASKAIRRRAPWGGRKRAADTKEKFIAVRCTLDDHAFIGETAAQAGMSIGAFLRTLALGTAGARAVKKPRIEREQLAKLLGEIGKLGSNVNQIARWANTDRARAEDGGDWRDGRGHRGDACRSYEGAGSW